MDATKSKFEEKLREERSTKCQAKSKQCEKSSISTKRRARAALFCDVSGLDEPATPLQTITESCPQTDEQPKECEDEMCSSVYVSTRYFNLKIFQSVYSIPA